MTNYSSFQNPAGRDERIIKYILTCCAINACHFLKIANLQTHCDTDQGTEFEFTVVQKSNQGTIRHRAVIDGGALFGYFLGKQKVTTKNIKLFSK